MPDIVTVQLDAADALAGRLSALGAELAAGSATTRDDGLRLGAALAGPAAGELAGTGEGWAALVEALATRTRTVADALAQAVASYRVHDGLVADRIGAGPRAAVAR